MNNKNISKILVNWYLQNKRDLPWRDISDPYKIWISEIILQQTRVNQGMSYYYRFIERFPNIISLATAEEDEVLKYWQGLGYYSRARNLHKAAKTIALNHNGIFPEQHAAILKLSGIGQYTAAAICSFAFNQAFAVLDGNVFRVISRLFGIDTPIDSTEGIRLFREKVNELLDKENPANHNQAIMEFGALQCTPIRPDCDICPLQQACSAFNQNTVEQLPIKSKKTKVTDRYFNYFHIKHKDKFYIQKRNQKDIWQNLYELFLIEDQKTLSIDEVLEHKQFNSLFNTDFSIQIENNNFDFKHILSHQRIFARFFVVDISKNAQLPDNLIEIDKEKLDNFAFSRLTTLFFDQYF